MYDFAGDEMALIDCIECGHQISDKATACPSCGYPINTQQYANVDSHTNNASIVDLNKYSIYSYDPIYADKAMRDNNKKYHGWSINRLLNIGFHNQYDIKNISEALNIYRYLIAKYPDSTQADNAKTYIDDIAKRSPEIISSPPMITDNNIYSDINNSANTNIILNNNIDIDKCYNILGLDSSASKDAVASKYTELLKKWNPSKYEDEPSMRVYAEGMISEIEIAYDNISKKLSSINYNEHYHDNHNYKMKEIPTHGGLVTIASILGFGILGGMCVGSYTRTKSLIQIGDYEGALKASKATYINSMIVICGVSTVILGFILFIFSK